MQQRQPDNSSLGRLVANPRSTDRYVHHNQRVEIPDGYMAVGLITSVHGLKGEVKVELHTDFPDRFALGARLFLGTTLIEVDIIQARPHKGQLLVQLAGVTTREEAETLRGQWFFIHEAQAAELDKDTYWIHEIIGLAVQTVEGRRLGIIEDVLATGANDVYIVKTEESVNRGQDLLLPAIADVIQSIDIAAGSMTVQLLHGMLEED